MRLSRTGRSTGFTLIELLAAVAIIAMLAAMLFPVLARAKTAGRKSKCQANLKQIGLAFQMYTADWSDSYPNDGGLFLWMGRMWRWPLKRYLVLAAQRDPSDPGDPKKSIGNTRNILWCPEDRIAKERWDYTSYAYSLTFYHSPEQVNSMTTADEWVQPPPDVPPPYPNITQKESNVRYPTKKAMAAEWLASHSGYTNAAGNSPSWWEPGGARNYLFADGHVKYIDASQILPARNGFPDINLTINGIAGKDVE